MKWAFKQQEATRQGKGHRKKTTTWKREEEESMREEQLLQTYNECHQRATSSSLLSFSLSSVLSFLIVSVYRPCTHPLIVALCLSVRFVALFILKHIPAAWCGFTSGLLLLLSPLLLHLYHSQTKRRPASARQSSVCKAIVLIVGGLLKKFCKHSSSSRTGSLTEPLVHKT